jgi:hypothetical protein
VNIIRDIFPGIRFVTDDELEQLAALDLARWNRFIFDQQGRTWPPSPDYTDNDLGRPGRELSPPGSA